MAATAQRLNALPFLRVGTEVDVPALKAVCHALY